MYSCMPIFCRDPLRLCPSVSLSFCLSVFLYQLICHLLSLLNIFFTIFQAMSFQVKTIFTHMRNVFLGICDHHAFVMVVAIFLGCGRSNVNLQFGYTALIWAAQKGHTDCVRLLIDTGANKEAKESVRVGC